MRFAASLFALLLSAGACANENDLTVRDDARAEAMNEAMDAYHERMLVSPDATEQTLGILRILNRADESELAERGRRWALSNPNAQAIHLLAALTCQYAANTPQRALCQNHQLLSQWQELDPTNAYSWVIVAAGASRSNDTQLLAQSSARILASKRFSGPLVATIAALRSSMAKDPYFAEQPAGERAVHFWGIALAIAMPVYGDVFELCPRARGEPIRLDRQPVCRHLASLMIDHSEDMSTASIGYVLALAYVDDETDKTAISAQQDTWLELRQRLRTDPRMRQAEQDWASDLIDQHTLAVIKHGEVAAMINWLAESAELAESSQRSEQR